MLEPSAKFVQTGILATQSPLHDLSLRVNNQSVTNELLNTGQKAQRINQDARRYGTFAEIGAGQEVARWFFRAGSAAGTVAKTISAYDMAVSDAIYGPTDRYVSRQRLHAMLGYEYDLLLERLNEKRGAKTAFFVFANTVATRREEGQGWLGIRFQAEPGADPSEILIHVRMLDKENVRAAGSAGHYRREPDSRDVLSAPRTRVADSFAAG